MTFDDAIPEGEAYIVKAVSTFRRPEDQFFQIQQVVDYAPVLTADDATTILEELVHLAAHLDLSKNALHNDLAGTALGLHFFEPRSEPFKPPRGDSSLLVIDLVRSYIHIHQDAVWPHQSLFDALRRLGFEVVLGRGRWRRVPYQNLWYAGKLVGSYPRSPSARVDRDQEPAQALWTNPRFCRQVILPYPAWPPEPASPELLESLTRWTPETDLPFRYKPALARLNPRADAYALGQFLAGHSADELADWFEQFAPLCYMDDGNPQNVLSTVLELETEATAEGEALAGALVRLATKMGRLGYEIPRPE